MQTIKLSNGAMIPIIGFGVFQIPANQTKKAVLDAIECGYRHIDTARAYGNETEVGEAIRECGLPREELFVTTKVYGAGSITDARNMIEASLKRLNIGYLDLMLVHCPSGNNAALWKGMEEYAGRGLLKSIGLSNFYGNDLDAICNAARIKPVVNQIECHVYRAGEDNRRLIEKRGMKMEAWSSLSSGRSNLFTDKVLNGIGSTYGKTNAQIALRYLVERGIIPIVKTTHKERMIENMDIFDFSLSEEDLANIRSLDNRRSVWGMYD